MFQWKKTNYLPNVFGIADDILCVAYDSTGKNHDDMLWKVLQNADRYTSN